MLRKFAILASIACSLAMTSNAWAGYITSNGTVELFAPFPDPAQTGANPPLTEITQLSSGSGTLFTNQVNGSPFAIGSTVRTVGTASISQAINGDNLPVFAPDGTPLVAIFALEGTIVSGGGGLGAAARFTGGSIWLASRVTDNSGFNRNNPLSWNFDDVFAKFDLAPQDAILPGAAFGIHGGSVAAPASSVNISAANSVSGANDGIFVFLEDLGFTPGAGFDNPGLGTFVGSEWLRDVETTTGVPNPNVEGIAAFTDQTLNATAISLTAAQITQLDTIANAAGLGDFSEGGYTPTSFGAGTGDFNADLSSENYILTVVPEPSSLALLGVGIGVLAFYRRRKSVEV